MDILDLLASDNYIPYNRTLAKELGIEPAILFGALCGYQRHYKMQEFFREQEKIIDDTCLSEYTIRQSTKILQDKGLIIVKKKGLPAKNYYQINTTRLIEYLSTSGCEIDTTGDYENNTTRNNENITTNNKIENKTKNKIDNKLLIKENIKEIIDYLNEKTNSKYSYTGKEQVRHISARLSEGYKVDDFKKVIDIKCKKWQGTEMEQYLRPSTLFGTKFENYLNEKEVNTYQKPQQHQHLTIDYEQLNKDYAGFVGTYIGGDE